VSLGTVLLPTILLIADTDTPQVVAEGRPHMCAVMIYMTGRGYATRRHRPRANPGTVTEINTHQRQAPRLMVLQCRLPAKSSPSCKSNPNLLQLQSRICRGRRALSNDQLRMNSPTGSVKAQSHLGRMRFVAIATSVVHPTLIVHPTTSIKNMNLALVESRRILVQR
jgi:hypothetical protein